MVRYLRHIRGSCISSYKTKPEAWEELLTGDGFYKLIKKLCTEACIESKQISPHSLRAGFITSAYMAGKDHIKTKQISGHRYHETYERYIRDADRYRNNAADLF